VTYAQKDVNQDESEQNDVDGMKKLADSTCKVINCTRKSHVLRNTYFQCAAGHGHRVAETFTHVVGMRNLWIGDWRSTITSHR